MPERNATEQKLSARAMGKADPKLQQMLEHPVSDDETIEVAVTLQAAERKDGLSPEDADSITRRLVDDVSLHCGEKPEALNIFRNIGAFVVAAKPGLIRALLDHEDVGRAMANRQD